MDSNKYFKKYIKYKKKYLQTKNLFELGGARAAESPNRMNLSGPTLIIYMSKTIGDDLYKFILIGESHDSKENICNPEEKEIHNYIDELFKIEDLNFDIFIEDDTSFKNFKQPKDKRNFDFKIEGYLDELRIILWNNYKENTNKKIHFTDIRNIDFYNNLDHKLKSFYDIINYIYDYTDYNDVEENEQIDDAFFYLISHDVYRYYEKLRKSLENKRLNKCKKTDIKNSYIDILKINKYLNIIYKSNNTEKKNIANSLLEKLEKLLVIYIEIFNIYMKKKIKILENFDEFFLLHESAININIFITELYTLLRIFSKDIKNNIIYNGSVHTEILYEYLSNCGFTTDLIKEAEQPEISDTADEELIEDEEPFRCLRNIIPFQDYFKEDYNSEDTKVYDRELIISNKMEENKDELSKFNPGEDLK